MTTLLAILALAVLSALFGLVTMRGRQGGCDRERSCVGLGKDGACGGNVDRPECPLALRGASTRGE